MNYEIIELPQAMAWNACVNTGQPDSGQEHRPSPRSGSSLESRSKCSKPHQDDNHLCIASPDGQIPASSSTTLLLVVC